jgi:hypothetical protein
LVLLPLWIWSIRRTSFAKKYVSFEKKDEKGKVIERQFAWTRPEHAGEYFAVHLGWLIVMFAATCFAIFV